MAQEVPPQSKKEPEYRPNEPEKERQWQASVVEKFREFGVTQNAEYFIVPVRRKDGSSFVEYVPKHSGASTRGISVKDFVDFIPREEVVEAVVKMYPSMDEPNIKEAILLLRKSKEGSSRKS